MTPRPIPIMFIAMKVIVRSCEFFKASQQGKLVLNEKFLNVKYVVNILHIEKKLLSSCHS